METAIEILIKFMKLVLTEIDGDDFRIFLNLIYLTKKALELEDNFQNFVFCLKCHKLYQKDEVTNFQQRNTLTIMKYQYVEFPNLSLYKSCLCNTLLS